MTGVLRSELYSFLLALQFLTRCPIPISVTYSDERAAASVRHYPMVGVFVGVVAAAAYSAASLLWPPVVAALLSTTAVVLLTGGLHEDGLADTFDGIGGASAPERVLEIMKDSRIGAFGALSMYLIVSTKLVSLSLLHQHSIVYVLVAAHALSRLSSVVVIATSRYVGVQGRNGWLTNGIGPQQLIYPVIVGAGCCLILAAQLSPTAMLAAFGGLSAGHFSARCLFERILGGYTGDCLGATQQFSEIGIYLGVLACL